MKKLDKVMDFILENFLSLLMVSIAASFMFRGDSVIGLLLMSIAYQIKLLSEIRDVKKHLTKEDK